MNPTRPPLTDPVDAELGAVLRALLPAGAAAAARHAPFDETLLFPEEAAASARMMQHRRREFAAGRLCAREALAALGGAPVAILRTATRGPQWPKGIFGSITHTNEVAMAAVMDARPGLFGIGIDVERIDRVDDRLLRRIAAPEELARIGMAGDAAAERALLFAARECVHKCWEPATEEKLVFSDVGIMVGEGVFAVSARGEVGDRFEGWRWEGRWRRAGEVVVAALVLWQEAGPGWSPK